MDPSLLSISVHSASMLFSFSGKIGTDLFKNLKQQSLESITPSNLNTFFMPKTKSTFHEFQILMHKFQICVHVLYIITGVQ